MNHLIKLNKNKYIRKIKPNETRKKIKKFFIFNLCWKISFILKRTPAKKRDTNAVLLKYLEIANSVIVIKQKNSIVLNFFLLKLKKAPHKITPETST